MNVSAVLLLLFLSWLRGLSTRRLHSSLCGLSATLGHLLGSLLIQSSCLAALHGTCTTATPYEVTLNRPLCTR